MTTVESAFVLIDRASPTIRAIRLELRELEADAKSAGRSLDDLSGPRTAKQMEGTAREMRQLGTETDDTGRKLDSAGQSADRAGGRLDSFRQKARSTRLELSALGSVIKLLKWPALIAGAGGAVQILAALGAGAVALLPKVVDLSGGLAGYGAVLVGVGASMGVVKLATDGLSQALSGNKKALKDLTPEGRQFLQLLQSLHPAIQQLRSTAQGGLLPGLGSLLRDVKSQAPQIRGIVGQVAGDLGGLGTYLGSQITKPTFMRDLQSLADQGSRAFGSAARGGFQFATAIEQVLLAAQPFTDWLGNTFEHLGKVASEEAFVARQTGELGGFFDRTKSSMQTMGHVADNVFGGLRGVMEAARGDSDSLWSSVDRTSKQFDDWANSVSGQSSMRTFFDQMRPILSDTVSLLGMVLKGVAGLTTGSTGTQMLDAMKQAGPAIGDAIRSIITNFGPVVVQSLGDVVRLMADMAGSSGPLTLVARAVGSIANAADDLLHALGPLGPAIATAIGTYGLLSKMKVFSALDSLRAKWVSVGTAADGAAAAESRAASIGAMPSAGSGRVPSAGGDIPVPVPSVPGAYGLRQTASGLTVAEEAALGVGGGATAAAYLRSKGVLSDEGAFTKVYGNAGASEVGEGIRGARYAATPALGELSSAAAAGGDVGLLSKLGGVGSKAFGALGKIALPLTVISGLLGALGTQGGVGNRALGGLNAATFGLGGKALNTLSFGLIPPGPGLTAAQRQSAGGQFAQHVIKGLPQTTDQMGNPASLNLQRRGIGSLRQAIQLLPGNDSFNQNTADLHTATVALQHELKQREAILRQSQQDVDHQLDATSIKHAQSLVTDFSNAFGILAHAKGPQDAMKQTVDGVLGKLNHMREAGKVVLGDSMLDWAHQQAQKNPELMKEYDDLVSGIKKKFDDMGKHISIVNGQILTGSKAEWQQISAALSTQTEKAREEVSNNFTAIQQQALGSLVAMGFTHSQALQLVRGSETAQGARNLNTAAKLASSSNAGVRQAGLDIPGAVKLGNTRATGGRMYRLPGTGTLDTVAMADGGVGAPGELVLNTHTERDIDRDLSAAGKPSLDQRVRRETRPHHRRAFGGRMGGSVVVDPGVNMSVGQEPMILQDLRSLSNELGQTVYVISGYRSPAHSVAVGGFADDPHTRGQAADIGVGSPSLASMFGVREAQLRAVGLYRPFYPPDAHEVNHVQLFGGGPSGTPTSGVGAAAAGMAFSPQQIKALRVPNTNLAGVPGAMVTRAGSIYASGLTQRINQALGLGAGGGASFSGSLSGSTPNQVRQFFGSEGFNRTAIAGMLGNAMQESSMKWNEPGGGLFQQISNFGAGAPPLRVQLETMLPQVMGLRAAMNAAGSPGAAAQIFEQGFEKAALPAMSNRIRYANAAYSSGYSLGGRKPEWGGWNAAGADVTVNRPTVFGAGEAGPERVRITPAGGGGHQITIQRGAVQVNSTGGGKGLERYVDMRLHEFAEQIAEEIEAGEEEPASVVSG